MNAPPRENIILIHIHKDEKFYSLLSASVLGSSLKQVIGKPSVFIWKRITTEFVGIVVTQWTVESRGLGFSHNPVTS